MALFLTFTFAWGLIVAILVGIFASINAICESISYRCNKCTQSCCKAIASCCHNCTKCCSRKVEDDVDADNIGNAQDEEAKKKEEKKMDTDIISMTPNKRGMKIQHL